jgi:UDP-N-acetylmuramyl pentapeptide phosphotransferase/UDP-N-acetylglucosamine-1-phosphate transferase
MSLALIVLSAVICIGLSALGTYWFSRTHGGLNALAIPNERSLHNRPIPKGGGLAVIGTAGLMSAWAALQFPMPAHLAWAAGAFLLVLLVFWLEDHRPIAIPIRMLAQFAAAAMLVMGGLVPEALSLPGIAWHWPVGLAVVFTALYAVWMTNLFNFMDGMDGFAGGMAAVGFGSMAALGWLQQQPLFALLNLYVALASAGFLVCNFPPARIFLGDVGSSTLGLLAAAFSLWADRHGIFPLWAAIMVFSPFIVDATVTLVSRLWHGENVFSPHKRHYYQRVVQLGWGHRRTVLCEYVLMLLSAGAAFGALHSSLFIQWTIILGLAVVYIGLMYVVSNLEKRRLLR